MKEFVHGDLGRTVPSVGSLLGCRADILQLDVVHVEDKWSFEEQKASTSSSSKRAEGDDVAAGAGSYPAPGTIQQDAGAVLPAGGS